MKVEVIEGADDLLLPRHPTMKAALGVDVEITLTSFIGRR